VCLWQDGTVLARDMAEMAHGHAEALAPMVDRVMRAAGVPFSDLGAVAVTVGPGSFTGLRVGLALARGLGLAVGCPVLGAATTTVLARMAGTAPPAESPVAVVLDARRAEVFLHLFGADGRPMDEPVSVAPDAVAARLPAGPGRLTGDGVALLPTLFPTGWTPVPEAERTPDPAALAALVAPQTAGTVRLARPLYVRPPDATLPPLNARTRTRD